MVASYLIMKTHSDLYDDMVGYLRHLPLVDWPSRALVVHLRRTIYPYGWSGFLLDREYSSLSGLAIRTCVFILMLFRSWVCLALAQQIPWLCCRIIKCLVAHDYKRAGFCKILSVVNLAAKVAKYPSVMLPSGKNNITNFSRIQYASLVSSFSEAHRTGYFAHSKITIVIVIIMIITSGVCHLISFHLLSLGNYIPGVVVRILA